MSATATEGTLPINPLGPGSVTAVCIPLWTGTDRRRAPERNSTLVGWARMPPSRVLGSVLSTKMKGPSLRLRLCDVDGSMAGYSLPLRLRGRAPLSRSLSLFILGVDLTSLL